MHYSREVEEMVCVKKGPEDGPAPIPEAAPLAPLNDYGVTKAAAELLAHTFRVGSGLPITVVFLFAPPVGVLRWLWWRLNIYGEIVSFVVGFPLAYFAWFGVPSLGLPAYKDRPYWQAFAVLFGLGMTVVIALTLVTPAERRTTLERFYRLALPPGFWRPIAQAVDPAESSRQARRRAHWAEAQSGLYTSAFAAALILGMSALLVQRTAEGCLLLLTALLLSRRVLRASGAHATTRPAPTTPATPSTASTPTPYDHD